MRSQLRSFYLLFLLSSACGGSAPPPAPPPDPLLVAFQPPQLEQVREAAAAAMAELPGEVRFVKVADKHLTRADVIEGGNQSSFVSARTVFQVVYPTQRILIDTGMDLPLHEATGGAPDHFDEGAYLQVEQALIDARLIVVTHEHPDHVGGLLTSANRDLLATKTLLTAEQVKGLIERPSSPRVALSAEQAKRYREIDYRVMVSIAPGMVLIKTPGHTPGSQMVFVHLASGRELLFVGDTVWAMQGVQERRHKPESVRLKLREEPLQVLSQLRWLHEIASQTDVLLVPCHDEAVLRDYVAQGILKSGLLVDSD